MEFWIDDEVCWIASKDYTLKENKAPISENAIG